MLAEAPICAHPYRGKSSDIVPDSPGEINLGTRKAIAAKIRKTPVAFRRVAYRVQKGGPEVLKKILSLRPLRNWEKEKASHLILSGL